MRNLILFYTVFVVAASGQSLKDFRSGASAVSFSMENGGSSLSRGQQDDLLIYSTFMRGFLYGLEGSSSVAHQSDQNQLLTPEEWMMNPGKSAPSFLAFIAKRAPAEFDESKVDAKGLKTILLAWYLDSHSGAKSPDNRSLTEKMLRIAFKSNDDLTAKKDFFVSREHGFIAKFPGKVETLKMDNALGSLTNYSSADENNLLIYQINVHDIVANREFKSLSEELIRQLTKSNFDAYCKESKAGQIKLQWSKVANWPTIEFSCTEDGFFRKGFISHKSGYAFLHGSKYYKITVRGLESNQALIDASLRFMASFAFADSTTLKEAEQ